MLSFFTPRRIHSFMHEIAAAPAPMHTTERSSSAFFWISAALMSAAAGDERLRASLLGGVGLAIVGGLLATLGTAQAGPGFRGGEIVVLAAVTCFVWYSRRTVTHFPGVRDLPKTAAALICASGVLLVFAIAGLGSGVVEARYDLSPRSLLLLVWMGPIAFAGASFLWLRATRMLGVTVADPIDGISEFVGVGNRLSARVADDVTPAPDGIGKRYAGASHFRFTGLDLDAVVERVERHPHSSWAIEPRGGFAFVVGPRNETIELFDASIS